MSQKPHLLDNKLYKLLREEDIGAFNQARSCDETTDLRSGDFRGLDLREMNAHKLDMSNAYFRGADLRGIDFSQTNLEGASIAQANISGCFFPKEISADELVMSLNHGTRLRYDRCC
ncbi:pentapeptide repeat-containing protein [Oceanospirillum sp.]|uniref:pentapeptide repeat-containing protein n=1 Tax=Oceanospirillum sp. TaxID=2021254 RepID=UPI003A91A2AC